MDNQPSPSILDTLRTVEFRLGLKGYNVDEVDEYLEKAAVEAESLQEQVRQSAERLRQAAERITQLDAEVRKPPAQAPATAETAAAEESLQRTLLLAQKFVDQAKRESEAEAAEVIAAAKAHAEATVTEAEARSHQLTTEAEQRLRDEVSRLEAMRAQLAADVENMARHLESERNRLHTTLSEVLTWVDENIQPATSLMALRPRDEQGRGEASQGRPAPRPAANGPTTTAPQGVQPSGAVESDTVAQVLDLRGTPSGERG